MNIMNKPTYADDYEFIVARECDGKFWFWGAYNDMTTADRAAAEIGGLIFPTARKVTQLMKAADNFA